MFQVDTLRPAANAFKKHRGSRRGSVRPSDHTLTEGDCFGIKIQYLVRSIRRAIRQTVIDVITYDTIRTRYIRREVHITVAEGSPSIPY